MFESHAQRLQQMFASSSPIPLVHDPAQAKQPPFVLHATYEAGDIYSGVTSNEYIRLAVIRPVTGLLKVDFQYSFHELSGQCDEWRVIVTGAKDSEREPLWELFHPRQQTQHWNNHVQPLFEFNGVKKTYEGR